MHLGILTTSYPRDADDPAGGFVAGFNRFLLSQGHSIEVVAAGADGSPAGLDPAGVWRLPSPLFYRGGAPEHLFAPSPAALSQAARFQLALTRRVAARAHAFDALVSHWLVPCGLAGAIAAPGRPHLAVAHSSDIHLLRRLGLTALPAWLSRRAALVYTAAGLVLPGAPGRVVPMGVEAASFAGDDAERAAARAALGLGPRPPAGRGVVLFLGRLVPVKGLTVLLGAAALDPAAPWDLLIAGDGPLRKEVQRRAARLGRRVRLLGEVRGPSRRAALLGSDALVLPSLALPDGRTEGAPTVVSEALCAGLPIVASAVGGVPDLVGDAGVLCPPGQPAALSAALRLLFSSPARLPALRARATAAGGSRDWSKVGPALLDELFSHKACKSGERA